VTKPDNVLEKLDIISVVGREPSDRKSYFTEIPGSDPPPLYTVPRFPCTVRTEPELRYIIFYFGCGTKTEIKSFRAPTICHWPCYQESNLVVTNIVLKRGI
jgi:hypothetical protein